RRRPRRPRGAPRRVGAGVGIRDRGRRRAPRRQRLPVPGLVRGRGASRPAPALPLNGRGRDSRRLTQMSRGPATSLPGRGRLDALPVLIATLVLVIVIGALKPRFLSFANLHDVLQQSVYVATLAAGLAFLIGMREIDLSVGSVFALTLIIGALLMKTGMNPWLAVALALALGGVMGMMNATLVQVIAIPAIVATLATLSMFRGMALALTDDHQLI